MYPNWDFGFENMPSGNPGTCDAAVDSLAQAPNFLSARKKSLGEENDDPAGGRPGQRGHDGRTHGFDVALLADGQLFKNESEVCLAVEVAVEAEGRRFKSPLFEAISPQKWQPLTRGSRSD
jgi:hypothetical protein